MVLLRLCTPMPPRLLFCSSYDEVGDGYLREFDLETYVTDLMPTLANLRKLQVRTRCARMCVN